MKKLLSVLMIAAIILTVFTGTPSSTAYAKGKAVKVTPKVTLSKTKFTYDGKAHKPSVTVKVKGKILAKSGYTVTYSSGRKNPGTYKVTVKLKGKYTGKKTVSFKIVPQTIKKFEVTGGKRQISVKVGAFPKQISGYQISYADNAGFAFAKKITVSNTKTKEKTISGLYAGTKYYVRIRTFKTVNGKKIWSAYSSKKSAKTNDKISEQMYDTPVSGEALLDELYKENPGNTVISNLSINMAFSMVLEGAEGTSREQLEKYLGIKKEDAADWNRKMIDIINDRNDDELKISIANSLWSDKRVEIKQAYMDLLIQYFEAEAETLDFKDPASADRINAWVSDKTNGLIKKIIDPDSLSEIDAMLVNALYFKGTWEDQYSKAVDGKFNGESIKVLKSGEYTYFENDKATAFAKPYRGGFEFIGILPKDEGEFTVSDLDIPGLLATRTTKYHVNATIPKFKTEYETKLPDALKALGVTDVFEYNGDLNEIGDDFFVTDAIHKTYVNVDEYGTEAAAVTAIAEKAGSALVETKEVTLNRPFVFLIYDKETNTVLFTGKIMTVK